MTRALITPGVAALAWLLTLAPAAAQTFTGPYLGVTVGYVTGTPEATITSPEPPFQSLRLIDAVPFDGWEIGGVAGARHTFGNGFVLGGEVGASLGRVEGRRSTILDIAGPLGVPGRLRRQGEVSFSLMAGAEIEPGTLVYAIGGGQTARFDFRFGDGTAGIEVRERGNLLGGHLGLGVERAFAPNMSLRIEYRYNRFAHLRTRTGPLRIRIEPDESTFRLGAIWRF